MSSINALEENIGKDPGTIRTELNAHANNLPTTIANLSRSIQMKEVGRGMKVPVSGRNPPYLTRQEFEIIQSQMDEMHTILLNHKQEINPEGYRLLNKDKIYDRALVTYFKAVADLAKIQIR